MFNFCIFILTYGRPNKIKTLKCLKNTKYPIFLICSDDDKKLPKYKEKYGDMVKVFNKDQVAKECKINFFIKDYRGIVFARNYSYILAKELGFDYFLQLDDDYTLFFKWTKFKKETIYDDFYFDITLDLLSKTKSDCIAWMQGGDFIGGANSTTREATKRKVMNSFFCKTDSPLRFDGLFNEDVNMYIKEGLFGKIFFSIPFLAINQGETQKNAGGMTEFYKDFGTYKKSFISKIINPSAVSLFFMGCVYKRVHHKINYNACAPKIISGRLKNANH